MNIRWVCGLVIVFFLEALALSNVFSQSPAHQTASGIHEVEVTGSGMDEESALKAAFVKAQREMIHSQRGEFNGEMSQDCEFDLEVIAPLVFNLKLDELRRVQRLGVEPVTGTPPVEPGLGETLRKALKSWFSK